MFMSVIIGEESETYRRYQAYEGRQIVPVQLLAGEEEKCHHREDGERYDFLDYLQLEQGERPTVALEAYPVGRNHEAVFKKGYPPGKEYYGVERPVF